MKDSAYQKSSEPVISPSCPWLYVVMLVADRRMLEMVVLQITRIKRLHHELFLPEPAVYAGPRDVIGQSWPDATR